MVIRVPTPRPTKREIKKRVRDYEEMEIHILESCSPGYAYEVTRDDGGPPAIFDIMTAEGYLIEVGVKYAITARGRRRLTYLHRGRLARWLAANYQWIVTTLIATASVFTALTGVIIATAR